MSEEPIFDELRRRLSTIVSVPHRNLGRWTTGQIFYHLAAAVEGSLEGLPRGYPAVVRWMVRPFRHVVTRLHFPP